MCSRFVRSGWKSCASLPKRTVVSQGALVEALSKAAGRCDGYAPSIDEEVRWRRRWRVEVSEPRESYGVCRQCFFKELPGKLLEVNQPVAGG